MSGKVTSSALVVVLAALLLAVAPTNGLGPTPSSAEPAVADASPSRATGAPTDCGVSV